MKKHPLRIVLAVLSAVAVLLLVMGDIGRKSPGPVTTVHGRIAELDGGNTCSGCHGGLFSSMSPSCRECHPEIDAQIKTRKGLHGTIEKEKALVCAVCHSEHHGENFQLVNRLAFAQVGVEDVAKFDHEKIGWRMYGRHAELLCSKCHLNAAAELLPEGGKRYLGVQQDCKTCHDDVHEGRMKVGCAQCHGQESFQKIEAPGHDLHLPLTGPHASANCRACHNESDGRGLETLKGGTEPGQGRQCGDCHQSPHREAFVQGAAQSAGKPVKQACAICHRPDLTSFRDERVTVSVEQHAHSGFQLVAPHAQVPCSSCHLPSLPDFKARYPNRSADHCGSCHQDPHGGQFDGSTFMANGCIGCHERQHFLPHGFDKAHHAKTDFPLDGKHAVTDCEHCHKRPAPALPRAFHDTPDKCEECHQDAHQGAFAAFDAELKGTKGGRCARCHTNVNFTELPPGGFDHAKYASFAIHGSHAQIACEDCHPRTTVPDQFGRTFGRVAKPGKAYRGCVECHRDVHDGQFDKEGIPQAINGRTGCERCHDTVSFRHLPHGFDHTTFAGFPLDGSHGAAKCEACHPLLPAPDAKGRTWTRAKGAQCWHCHQDAHGGQFERLGTTDCTRCHRTAIAFHNLAFRHNLDSRFRLDENHEKVACSGCHRPERIKDAVRVRYKPLKSECVDCHGPQGTPLRRPK